LLTEIGWETEQFQRHRPHLEAVAYRMLGSVSEAEDALQEAWLRLSRSQQETIQNARAWLTTIVGRVCIDMLLGLALLVVLEALSPAERVAYVLHDMFALPGRRHRRVRART
jgi:RNA polymerase sigma-70 factor (ECF subfamily)